LSSYRQHMLQVAAFWRGPVPFCCCLNCSPLPLSHGYLYFSLFLSLCSPVYGSWQERGDEANSSKGDMRMGVLLLSHVCSLVSTPFQLPQWIIWNVLSKPSHLVWNIFWKPWPVYKMVRYGWPSISALATSPQNPTSVGHDRVWEWWLDNVTVSLTYLAAWADDSQAVKRYPRTFIHGINSSVTVSEKPWWFCLDLDWHSLSWISAHGHGILTIFITFHHN
jgi:hypothetical protein